MDREQIEKWAREATEYADRTARKLPLPQDVSPGLREIVRWERIRDDHFARLVWNAAIANARQICCDGMDGTSEKYSEACYTCAELINDLRIDALKEQP